MPRVETLLGVRSLDDVDEAALRRLVDGQIPEDVDLDFKQALYGSSDGERKELAKDIAAFANGRGGLLIIGVREQEEVAVELTPVAPSEDLRLQQTIVSLVAPVPMFDLRAFAGAGGGAYYLVAVPRSPQAPHAVRVGNDALRYPRRDGTHTRYLAESEVADAYRSRFVAAAAQVDRLGVIEAEGRDSIATADGWLTVAMVPNVPGDTGWGVGAHDAVREWVARQTSAIPTYTRLAAVDRFDVGVSTRRFVTRFNEGQAARFLHVELHRDGSGFIAANLWNDQPPVGVPDQSLAIEIIVAIGYLARFAQDIAGVWGDATVSVRVTEDIGGLWIASHPDLGLSRGTEAIGRPEARHMVAIAPAAQPGPGQLAAAKPFLDDIWGAFGIPESPHVTADGDLVLAAFNSSWRAALQPLLVNDAD